MNTVSAEHIEDEALQQLHDGALDAARLADVQQHLSSCESCAGRGAKLDRLQRLLRVSADEVSSGIDSDALFARISSGIEAAREVAPARQEVASVGSSWLTRLFEQHRWAPAAGVMVAAAAAVLLTLYKPIEPEDAHEAVGLPSGGNNPPAEPGVAPTPAEPTPAEPTAGAVVPGNTRSEVVEVDFGTHTGTVFDIAMDDGTSTAVVWINDDSGE
jgi:hypothetical protein